MHTNQLHRADVCTSSNFYPFGGTRVRLCFACGVACLWVCNAVAFSQSISHLGALSGESSSVAFSVSEDGRVVVGQSGGRAFRWATTGGMHELPPISPPLPGYSTFATSVSADGGLIAGGSNGKAILWDSSQTAFDLGSLPGAQLNTWADEISANGAVIVGSSGINSFTWTADTGALFFLPESQLRAVSNNGRTVAGYSYVGQFGFKATSGGAIEVLIPNGGVEGLSDDGSFAVGWQQTPRGQTAARWSPLRGLETLASSIEHTSSYASSVSNGGRTAGALGTSSGTSIAMIWSDAISAEVLLDRLEKDGADVSGWTSLVSALDISADGRFVVGHGLFNGQLRAYLADLRDSCPGDITNGGSVDATDLSVILAAWGTIGQGEFRADIDGSGIVDGEDLALVLSGWGPCPR